MARILEPEEMHFTEFEPQVQNRFIMYINGLPSYLVKGSNKPTINLNPITLEHINMKRKLAGKPEWQDIQLTLYQPINPSGAQAVMEWIRLCYESVTGRAGYADFYKKEVILNMLGPVGDIVEEWKLKGAFVSATGGGALDWGTADPVDMTITITYDYAVLEF